jgi:hypothetical protein
MTILSSDYCERTPTCDVNSGIFLFVTEHMKYKNVLKQE